MMSLSSRITRVINFFYLPIFSRVMSFQTFKYAACGGGNMVLDFLLYYIIYNYVLQENLVDLGVIAISAHIAAFLVQFPITFFTGFWLNKHVVFIGSIVRTHSQLIRYLIVVCGSILINYLSLKLFVEYFGLIAELAKILTIVITVIYSYLMQKNFTFK